MLCFITHNTTNKLFLAKNRNTDGRTDGQTTLKYARGQHTIIPLHIQPKSKALLAPCYLCRKKTKDVCVCYVMANNKSSDQVWLSRFSVFSSGNIWQPAKNELCEPVSEPEYLMTQKTGSVAEAGIPQGNPFCYS